MSPEMTDSCSKDWRERGCRGRREESKGPGQFRAPG